MVTFKAIPFTPSAPATYPDPPPPINQKKTTFTYSTPTCALFPQLWRTQAPPQPGARSKNYIGVVKIPNKRLFAECK